MTRLNPTLRRTISGRVLGWNGHRVESVDGVSFRSICGWDVPKTDDVTLLCGDPAPRCRDCRDVLRRETEPTIVDRAQCAKAALREALRSIRYPLSYFWHLGPTYDDRAALETL